MIDLTSTWGVKVFPAPKIITEPRLSKQVQYRFPIHRKKRVLRKWAKRSCNYRAVPDMKIYKIDNAFVCHPVVANALRQQLTESGHIGCLPILAT